MTSNRAAKINMLKKRQENWNSGTPTASKSAMLWTCGSADYNGFAVRSSKPSSSTPKKKTYQHSSLRDLSNKPQKTRLKGKPAVEIDQKSDVSSCVSKQIDSSIIPRGISQSPQDSQRVTYKKLVDTPPYTLEDRNPKEKVISNHFCPCCEQLMLTERSTPYIVTPCAHTVCLSCISGVKSCPLCLHSIEETQVNHALSAIIKNVKRKQQQKLLEEQEKEARKYVEEYEQLTETVDAMRDEAKLLVVSMESTTTNLLQKRESMKELEGNVVEKKKQINLLTSEVHGMESRHSEIKKDCVILEQEYKELKDQLTSVHRTVSKLENSQDKVKLLVEGLCPGLKLD